MTGTEFTILDSIIKAYGSTRVRPSQFFVSWNTVVTLAFTGFSASLLRMKSEIDQRVPELKQENPGSRWPKTTLGCLMDGEQLTTEEVDGLREICEEHSRMLGDPEIPIKNLSFVMFQCRTLEKRLLTHRFELSGEGSASDEPPDWDLEEVSEVMDQFSLARKVGYYPRLAPEGRTLWDYYRQPHVETTLVADLQFPAQIDDVIAKFRSAADTKLAGKFGWFEPDSWHLTIRGLVFK